VCERATGVTTSGSVRQYLPMGDEFGRAHPVRL